MQAIGLSAGIKGKSVIVQGFGNVGYYSALYLHQAGAKVIGVAEYNGGVYNEAGLNIEALKEHQQKNGTLKDFPKATFIENGNDLLTYSCDILVPAALENQISAENAKDVKAKIIGEAANGPITREGEEILLAKDVMIIPDMYLNAGGVTVSYFEWLKNLSRVSFGKLEKRYEMEKYKHLLQSIENATGDTFSDDEVSKIVKGASERDLVNSGLEETMVTAYHQLNEMRKQKGIKSLRTAAFILALDRIAISYTEMGIFP
jgi:glutamate dehydrogenase (NAD(P)+)